MFLAVILLKSDHHFMNWFPFAARQKTPKTVAKSALWRTMTLVSNFRFYFEIKIYVLACTALICQRLFNIYVLDQLVSHSAYTISVPVGSGMTWPID
jgi:hypothetical protein